MEPLEGESLSHFLGRFRRANELTPTGLGKAAGLGGAIVGNFLFINDIDKLCKGIIEIMYKLRNILFHGEIIPDSDTNKVYEPAYQILYTLIQAL